MKNIILSVIALTFSCTVFGQVAIGKSSITPIQGTTTQNPSISLEFGDYVPGQGKGIIVPWVTSAAAVDAAGTQEGTIIFDTNDKVLKYRRSNGTWVSLTRNDLAIIDGETTNTTGQVDVSLQSGLQEKTTAKVAIGQLTDAKGILVLEDNNKAMILPKVPSPHLNIVNPEPGTMVYDTATKQLAVFNGKVWSFWKP